MMRDHLTIEKEEEYEINKAAKHWCPGLIYLPKLDCVFNAKAKEHSTSFGSGLL